MSHSTQNVDSQEVAKFEAVSSEWWDPSGAFRTLHEINPLRLEYVRQRVGGLAGKRIVDVGCGGGILTESMAEQGAIVTGIDAGDAPLSAAREHQSISGLTVEYIQAVPEAFAKTHANKFDVVTCMELLEHVPNPASVVQACAQLVRARGHVFFSTINRTPKAYLLAIIGAEYILGLLPKGTHDYARFIRPSELANWAGSSDLIMKAISGLSYNPLTHHYALGSDIAVNYLVQTQLDDGKGS